MLWAASSGSFRVEAINCFRATEAGGISSIVSIARHRRILSGSAAAAVALQKTDDTRFLVREIAQHNSVFQQAVYPRNGRAAVIQESGAQVGPSDQALMVRVVTGDESALASLYDRYSGAIFGLLRRILGDPAAAEEVLQDLFFSLWKNAEKFDSSRGSLYGWLVVSARNRAISKLRTVRPSDTSGISQDSLEQTVSSGFNLESAVAKKELVEKVKGALDALPGPQREAVELAFFEGLTHSEIAARVDEPLGTVKTRIRTGVQVLRQALR
jgi:RNA polymerase sigma-70 factor (ECF subfamily)